MKILVTTSTFPLQAKDSTPGFVYNLANVLGKYCEVDVLAPDNPKAEQFQRMGSVNVERFTYFLLPRLQRLAYGHGMRQNLRSSFLAKIQVLPFFLRRIWSIRSQVRQNRIDLVNSHWLVPQGLSAALARGQSWRFAHVASVHAGDVYLLNKVPQGGTIARFIVQRTDAVFADGSHVRETLDELLGYPSKAIVQPMGAHIDFFRGGEKQRGVESPFRNGFLLFGRTNMVAIH